MAARYDRTIVIWKGVLKQLDSIYVMESRVSSNCTRNIHGPSAPEKEVNRKENTPEKIAKRGQIATDLKIYAYSNTDLSEVLFNNILFYDKENRDLSSMI